MDLKMSTSQLSAIRKRTISLVSDTSRPLSGTRKLPATTLRITGCPIQTVYPPSMCPPCYESVLEQLQSAGWARNGQWYSGLNSVGGKYQPLGGTLGGTAGRFLAGGYPWFSDIFIRLAFDLISLPCSARNRLRA